MLKPQIVKSKTTIVMRKPQLIKIISGYLNNKPFGSCSDSWHLGNHNEASLKAGIFRNCYYRVTYNGNPKGNHSGFHR